MKKIIQFKVQKNEEGIWMKLFFSLLVILTLWGCQNDEQNEDTQEAGNENNSEEETDSQVEESGNDESTETDNQSESDTSEDTDSATNEESTDETEENASSEDSSNEDTRFDINSDEVQDQLFNLDNADSNSLTFSQDVITEGMTQTEVEDLYGEFDLIYPGEGRPAVIYGNLGVSYSEAFPYGTDDEQAREDIDPDENRVEDVFYYADVPYDEVISALGEPDTDVYETTEGPVGGLLLMEYELEERENSTIIGQFSLHEEDNGELVVDLLQINEEPNDGEMLEPEGTEVSDEDEERINFFIETYIDSLMDYYNNGDSDRLLTMTQTESPNFWAIEENKESGDFSDHETYNIEILDIEETQSEFQVTVEREYSHASSDGRETTEVVYTIIETPRGFQVFDYEE